MVLVVVQRRGVSAGSHGGQSGVVVVIGLGGVVGVLAGMVVGVDVVDCDPFRGGGAWRGVGVLERRRESGGRDGKRAANASSHRASARVSEAAVCCCSTTAWPFVLEIRA